MDIHILCGGQSTEHEISLRSARSIINQLNKDKYRISYTYITRDGKFVPVGFYEKDIKNPEDLEEECELTVLESLENFVSFINKLDNPLIIPVIHGSTGEDGQIQGFLKTLQLRYVGNELLSSALCFDKALTNDIFELNGIPQAKYYSINKFTYETCKNKEALFDEIIEKLGKKVFVKPSNNGSSVGVSKARRDNLKEAIEEAFKYDAKVLIEEEIIGEELEISVVGNHNPKASLPGSYSTEREVFDYTAKYHDTKTIRNIPHELNKDLSDEVRQLAIDSYVVTGCRGFARVDIFMDKDNNFFVNEINTFPGMTPTSLSTDLWRATDGTTYSEFLDILIDLANERL